jgi:pilus assembly protein CpaB
MARTITRPRGFPEGSNRAWALAASVGLAVIAAIFAFAALRAAGGGDSSASTATTTPVLVATRAIKAGDAIPADALRVASLPADVVVKTALTSLDGLGPNLVASVRIEEGEQVTPSKLGRAAGGGRLPVPPGKRAVPIGVTEDKIFGGLLTPGDRVDVIGIITNQGDAGKTSRVVTLVQDAEVLAVGSKVLIPTANLDIAGNPIATDTSNGVISTAPSDLSAQPDAKSVTLAVTPEDAMVIALAQEEASVWLSLRAPGDSAVGRVAPQQLPGN